MEYQRRKFAPWAKTIVHVVILISKLNSVLDLNTFELLFPNPHSVQMWKGTINSFLRYNQHLLRHVPSKIIFARHLNISQTAEALRPFLFAVHPDFFGQHPKQRATNEKSLKQLYAYIDNLRGVQHVTPVDLKFYLRNHVQDPKTFRHVSISLLSQDVYNTVTHVLQSCDLSTDHVEQKDTKVQYGNSNRFMHKATWDEFYYDYVEKARPKRPSANLSMDDADIPLCLWMKLNLDNARQRIVSSEPIRKEANELKEELTQNLGLLDIGWKCPWDINNFRSCLRMLRDLTIEYTDIFQNLKDGKLVFGSTTRLSYDGKAVLGHRDIPQYWLGLVNNLPKYFEILDAISDLEHQIASHLGGIRVCRQHLDKVPFKSYHQVLSQLLASIHMYLEEINKGNESTQIIPPKSLADMEVQIINGSRPPLLSPSGKIYIANNSPLSAIIEYLLDNQVDARQILKLTRGKKIRVAKLIQQCKEELQFDEFSQKDTVTNNEMQSCCQRLIGDHKIWGMNLVGAKIRVGRHYNLLGSGEMCIPWNWK